MTLSDFLQFEPGTDFIRVTGHRIGLAEVVRLCNRGSSAEIIAGHLPTLSLAEIYSVLGYYLKNQADVDDYVTGDDEGLRVQEANAGSRKPILSFDELRKRFNVLEKSGS